MSAPSSDPARHDPLEQRALWISIAGLALFLAWHLPRTLGVISNIPGFAQIEGAVVHMGELLWRGASPYPDPLKDKNISFLYGPLAPEILGLAFLINGKSFVLPRLLSTLSVFATGACAGVFVSKRAGWTAGLWTALAWAAIQSTFAGFFSLARIDSISNFFIILSITSGIDAATRRSALLPAAASMACALLCRQTAAIPFVILIMALFWHRGARDAARYAFFPLFIFTLVSIAMHFASDGWSSRYIFSPGQHAWALPEFKNALSRLFVSPDSWALWLLCIFGATRAPLWLLATAVPVFLLALIHASRWAALTVSLAPAFALAVPVAAFASVRERGAGIASRSIIQLLFIIFPATLYFVPAPAWGFENPRAAAAARAESGVFTINSVRAHPGRALVNGFQEYALLAGADSVDDVHSALGPDTAGDPALDFVNLNINQRRYSIILLNPPELAAQAASIREIRPGTSARLAACVAAIQKHYKQIDAGRGIVNIYIPASGAGQ